MRKLMIVLAIMLFMVGCSKEDATKDGNNNDSTVTNVPSKMPEDVKAVEGYSYEYNGVTIPMNVDANPVLKALGEPVEQFEAASCAFQGLDKMFYYNGFELGTYPIGDKDFISYVNFLDDSIATEKGIYIGSTAAEVVEAYGKEYTEDSGSYVYHMGKTKLTFIIEEDAVISITYAAVVEGLNN